MRADPGMAAARAFVRGQLRRLASRVDELPSGFAIVRPELPRVFDLNLVWLDAVAPQAGADAVADLVERVQQPAGLSHRKAAIADEEAGARLAPAFREAGWEATSLLFMAQRRAPDRPAGGEVRELDASSLGELTERRLRASYPDYDDEVVAQLVATKPLVEAVVSARFFAALDDGEPVSSCDLYLEDGVAQVEDVHTLPGYEGRGFGRACTLRAVAEARSAGAELVFLVAEENDWPRQLYTKLGFDPIGRTFEVSRRLAPPAGSGA